MMALTSGSNATHDRPLTSRSNLPLQWALKLHSCNTTVIISSPAVGKCEVAPLLHRSAVGGSGSPLSVRMAALRHGIAAVFAVALVILVICAGVAAGPSRVRRELRSLSPVEYRAYAQGLGVMLSISTDSGKLIFGSHYREYNYFQVKHAISTLSPFKLPGVSGANSTTASNASSQATFDLAHFGPWFATFHAALVLEFENSMLAVVPELKALPYWEAYEDLKGTPDRPGKYYNTSDSVFTPKYAGSLPGDPQHNYSVHDGVLGDFQIQRFDAFKYKSVSHIYSGSPFGLLRSSDDNTSFPYLVRYPTENFVQVPYSAYFAPGLELNYTWRDFARCSNISLVRNAWDFLLCIDFTTSRTSGLLARAPNVTAKWRASPSVYTHNMFHALVAGVKDGTFDNKTNDAIFGDGESLCCSLNEAFLWFPFHSNIVRLFMIWLRDMAAAEPWQAYPTVMWGYPRDVDLETAPYTWPGAELDAELTPLMPYTGVFQGSENRRITHRFVLWHLWQSGADFTYDRMSFGDQH